MSRSQLTNLPASVLQRLLTVSKSLKEDFTLTLTRYAIERFLYRLSRSPFADRFVLKGAMLMDVWAKQPFRRTRDLDLLGYGEPSAAHLREVFAELCATMPAPRVHAYPREAVIAEKFHAMVVLGLRNSRMKDFFDLALIARTFTVAGERLAEALQATFARRHTPIPAELPFALSEPFFLDPTKRRQWEAFVRKGGIRNGAEPFEHVVPAIRAILLPPMQALIREEGFTDIWPPGGPWKEGR